MMSIKLGFRNVFRNGKRTSIILLTIAICTAVIMVLGGIFNFLFDSFKKQAVAARGHITLKVSDNETQFDNYEHLVEKISKIEGVRFVVPQAKASGIVGFGDKSAIFDGIGVNSELDREVRRFIFPDRELESLDRDGVDIGEILAKNINVNSGDIVNLFITGPNGKSKGLSLPTNRVVNTEADLMDRVYIQLPLHTLLDRFGSSCINLIKIYVDDEDVIERVIGDILTIQEININTFDEPGSLYLAAVNVYMSNYYFILIVVVLTLLFAVSSTITMSVMERVSELGTLRSFGVGKKSIVGMFTWEGLFLGVSGFIMGIVITIIIIILTDTLGGIYLPPPPTTDDGAYVFVNFSKGPLFLSFVISIVVSIVASLISTLKVSSLTIIEELRHV